MHGIVVVHMALHTRKDMSGHRRVCDDIEGHMAVVHRAITCQPK